MRSIFFFLYGRFVECCDGEVESNMTVGSSALATQPNRVGQKPIEDTFVGRRANLIKMPPHDVWSLPSLSLD